MSDVPPQQSKSSGTEEHPVIALFLDPLVCASGFFVRWWKSFQSTITSKLTWKSLFHFQHAASGRTDDVASVVGSENHIGRNC